MESSGLPTPEQASTALAQAKASQDQMKQHLQAPYWFTGGFALVVGVLTAIQGFPNDLRWLGFALLILAVLAEGILIGLYRNQLKAMPRVTGRKQWIVIVAGIAVIIGLWSLAGFLTTVTGSSTWWFAAAGIIPATYFGFGRWWQSREMASNRIDS